MKRIKKMIPVFLAALMIVMSLPTTAIVAKAEQSGTQVLNATPKVDGVIDAAYKLSASDSLTGPSFYTWGEVKTEDMGYIFEELVRKFSESYDEEAGAPQLGIAPGTKFEDLSEEFVCELCSVGKEMFSEVKE